MIGQTIYHYKILEKLGEGGMGVVYKAQDTKLDRTVALKFLPPRVANSEQNRARFLQEAKAAASLNHQNICTIHGVEEKGDEFFIVMEYVDGATLRDRNTTPSQPLETILSHGIQIGEALHEAHSKGIVHRDIKAENIMVSAKGQVKVMDFGLAKIKGALKLTRTSGTVGTIGYMAPEQIQGSEADVRSDIFSFGVVLYEMLTGRLPFRGEHEAAMMYSIINEPPVPLETYRSDSSAELALILGKALEKHPEDRYQNVSDLMVDLRRVKKKSSGVLSSQVGLAKDPEFQKTAQSLDIKTTSIPRLKRRNLTAFSLAAAVMIVAVSSAIYLLFFPQRSETITSLAVMPFENATGDQNLEYLTDGITEGIINNLSRLSNLRVMSRTSVFRYKGKEIDPREVGTTLGVQAVLTGRMTQRPNGFSVSLELVDSRDSRQIWGELYTRSLSDISTLEREVPQEISSRLQLKLSGEDQANSTTASTADAEAYQLYLKGRFNWQKRTPDALNRSIDFYTQAIERDPSFAQAYTGLAETYAVIPVYFFPPPREAFERAKYYALKALELDPKRAEAFAVLGYAKWSSFDFDGGERDFKRAIELNPRYATTHQWYQMLLSTSGRHHEAIAQIQRAQELDPLSLVIQTNAGVALAQAGRYEEAIVQYHKVLATEPNFPLARLALGRAFIGIGKLAEAISEFEKAQTALGGNVFPYLASSYALMGKHDQAQKILVQIEAQAQKGEKVEAYLALVYMAMGQKEKAVEWLERLYESRYINIVYLGDVRDFPKMTGMDSDPRIQSVLKMIGVK
ncbi:MAG: protein kinase [Bacteroidota bacterium]